MIRILPLAALLCCLPLAAQTPADLFVRHRVVEATASPDGALIAYTQRTADSTGDRFAEEIFVIPAGGGEPWWLGAGSKPAFAPQGEAIAWIGPEGQLMSRDSLAAVSRIRYPGGRGAVTGFRWSPNAGRLVVDVPGSLEEDGLRVWGRALRVLVIVEPTGAAQATTTGTPGELRIGPSDPDLPGALDFDWLDDSTLVIAGRDLGAVTDPDASYLYRFRLGGGDPEYLIGEGGRWHTPVVSPDGEWIAFTGHPVGPGPWSADELLVVRRDGTGLKRLTVGLDRDVRDVHWESDSRHLWFATEDRGSRNLQRVDSRNGRIGPTTSGSHFLSLGDIPRRGDWAVGVQSSVRTAGALVRFPLNHTDRLQALITPDREVPTGDIEEFDFRAADGTVLSGWLFLPPGFVPSTQYPLLVEIHGGPHAMAGNGYAPFALAHAAAGRLVLRVNPRGSTGYGFDIATGLAGRWPGQDIDDLREAITEVVARGFVDTAQITVVGQGAGGVMAEALRQADRRVRRTILRCTGGAWLQGSDAPDLAPWDEWVASRPFRRSIDLWMANTPIPTAAASRTPVLVVEGTPTAPEPLAFGESLHLVLARAGVLTAFHRLSISCTDAGPASQVDLFTLESQWLTTTP